MKYLKVNIWGMEIGRLVWEASKRRVYFMYNHEAQQAIPNIAPLLSPVTKRNLYLPIYGDERPLYQNLPPFIADSLPDSWGNTLFDKWVKENKIPRNKITPLDKLMFIGTRGMGALEYAPCAEDLNHTQSVDVKSLYELSLKILENRESKTLKPNDALTLQALLAVGTSAGGRQMKAILAIDGTTGEIRSGQTDVPDGFEYYILKFGDVAMSTAETEMTYYEMAKHAGIEMTACRLLEVEGVRHFLTQRFDRQSGRKIHIQTLAAINPEVRSYEELVATCRELSIAETEIEQLFARMVFNVMTNNTDDHNKNFSFLLAQDAEWHLAPAYDLTFIFNTHRTGPDKEHCLSIGEKTSDITKADLQNFARWNGIKNSTAIINRVADAIKHFGEHATKSGIKQPWRGIIQKTLTDNLRAFGYKEKETVLSDYRTDCFGRSIGNISITINNKGYYVVSAEVDARRHRRFIRQNSDHYRTLAKLDIYRISARDKIKWVEKLLPPA